MLRGQLIALMLTSILCTTRGQDRRLGTSLDGRPTAGTRLPTTTISMATGAITYIIATFALVVTGGAAFDGRYLPGSREDGKRP